MLINLTTKDINLLKETKDEILAGSVNDCLTEELLEAIDGAIKDGYVFEHDVQEEAEADAEE